VTAHVSRCIFHRRAARSGPSATGTGAAPVAGSYAGDGIAGLGGDSSAYFDLPCGWTRGDAWADLSDDGSQHMDPDGVMDHSALNLDLNDSVQWLTCPLGDLGLPDSWRDIPALSTGSGRDRADGVRIRLCISITL
jgi:hypothetical protein